MNRFIVIFLNRVQLLNEIKCTKRQNGRNPYVTRSYGHHIFTFFMIDSHFSLIFLSFIKIYQTNRKRQLSEGHTISIYRHPYKKQSIQQSISISTRSEFAFVRLWSRWCIRNESTNGSRSCSCSVCCSHLTLWRPVGVPDNESPPPFANNGCFYLPVLSFRSIYEIRLIIICLCIIKFSNVEDGCVLIRTMRIWVGAFVEFH